MLKMQSFDTHCVSSEQTVPLLPSDCERDWEWRLAMCSWFCVSLWKILLLQQYLFFPLGKADLDEPWKASWRQPQKTWLDLNPLLYISAYDSTAVPFSSSLVLQVAVSAAAGESTTRERSFLEEHADLVLQSGRMKQSVGVLQKDIVALYAAGLCQESARSSPKCSYRYTRDVTGKCERLCDLPYYGPRGLCTWQRAPTAPGDKDEKAVSAQAIASSTLSFSQASTCDLWNPGAVNTYGQQLLLPLYSQICERSPWTTNNPECDHRMKHSDVCTGFHVIRERPNWK